MTSAYIIAAALLCIASIYSVSGRPELYAASSNVNCGCQCTSYSYIKHGVKHGNCLTATPTGHLFCYVASNVYCSDANYDVSVGKYFSYEACSTPALTSPACAGFAG